MINVKAGERWQHEKGNSRRKWTAGDREHGEGNETAYNGRYSMRKGTAWERDDLTLAVDWWKGSALSVTLMSRRYSGTLS